MLRGKQPPPEVPGITRASNPIAFAGVVGTIERILLAKFTESAAVETPKSSRSKTRPSEDGLGGNNDGFGGNDIERYP